jgi:hypothetical protein
MEDNASLCKSQLELGREARDKYDKDLTEWKNKRERLYRTEQELLFTLDELDTKMANKWPEGIFEVSTLRCALGWNDTKCKSACDREYIGINTPWKNKKTRVIPQLQGGCLFGQQQCHCLYQRDTDDGGITKYIKRLLNVQADIKNHEENEFPKPAEIKVMCCSNEMGCNGGKCYGNIQTCDMIISNLEKKQDEPSILKNIKNVDFQINKLIENININTEYFDLYYKNFLDFNYSKNYNLVYQQLKNLYDNSTNYYNQIYQDTESILRYISNVRVYDSRIRASSPQKNESVQILNNLTDSKSDIIITNFRALLEKYVEIKDIYRIFNNEKNNYETMIKDNEDIQENMISINNNYDKIIEEFAKIENFIILIDNDKKKIFNQYEFIVSINNNIKKYLNDNKKPINNSELLYYTFRNNSCSSSPLPCSLYYDIAAKTFNDSNDIINQMEKKYEETTKIVNQSKIIYLLKIDTYERNKKLKNDEMLLKVFEEQEREQERIKLEIELALNNFIEQEKLELEIKMEQELLLQKLIEDENNIYNIVNLNMLDQNINFDKNSNIVIGANSDVITTINNGLSQTNVSLIIGGVALFLIIIIGIIPVKEKLNLPN